MMDMDGDALMHLQGFMQGREMTKHTLLGGAFWASPAVGPFVALSLSPLLFITIGTLLRGPYCSRPCCCTLILLVGLEFTGL